MEKRCPKCKCLSKMVLNDKEIMVKCKITEEGEINDENEYL